MNARFGNTLVNLTDADLDAQVYRIYAIDRLETLLRSGMDALVAPRL